MLRRLFILSCLSALLSGVIQSNLSAAPSLTKEATALLKKERQLQLRKRPLKIAEVFKTLGQPQKQLEVERYLWSGKDYKLVMNFRVFKAGLKLRELYFTQIPYGDNVDSSLKSLLTKVESFEKGNKGTSYSDVVQSLGTPGIRDKVRLIEYFWRAKEAIVIVLSANGNVELMNGYDQPRDYYNQEFIPPDD